MPTKRRITITLDSGEPTEEQLAERSEETDKMLAAIDADQRGIRQWKEKLKELSIAALRDKYPALINQLLECSDDNSFQANMAKQTIYTFKLKSDFSFLEATLAARVEGISATFEYEKETFLAECQVEA